MATTVTRSTGGALIPTSTGLSSQPENTLTAAQQLAEERGGQTFNQQVVPTGSNLTAADIAWLQQGKGMWGNPMYYDPTSPIQWALAGGIGVPATAFATTAAANALGLTNVSMAAADAAQLASQGLSEAQIANILQTSYNIPSGVASSLAFSAAEGGTPFEIAQFTGDVNFGTPASTGPSVPTAVTSPTTTVPGTVTVTGQPATTTGSSTLSDVVSGGLLTNLINIPAPADTVTITGEPATTSTTTTTPVDATTTILQPTTTTSAGTINITGTRIPAPADDYISPVIPPLINPVIPTAPTTIGSTTSTTTKPNIFNPSDILRLLGIAGVTAAGSQAGTGTGTGTVVTPRSDANIGSTTPQFGDEYYAAVQRYYNTFMPQTPRDVAGPLQQWYENRYGAPTGTAPTTPTMISPGAGTGAVSGGMATPSSAGTGMMTSAARAPMGAQTVQDFMAAQPTTSPSTGVTTGGIPGTSISAITNQQIFDVGRSLLQQGVNPQTILDRLATIDGVTQDQINTAAQWLQTSGYTGLNVPGSKSTIPTQVTRETTDTGGGGTNIASQVISQALSLSSSPYNFLETLSGALQTVQARSGGYDGRPGGKYGNTRTNTLDYITSSVIGDANDLIIEAQTRTKVTKEPLSDAIISIVNNNPGKYLGFTRVFDLLNERITPEQAMDVNRYDAYAKFVKGYSDAINGFYLDANLINRDLAAELSKPVGKPEFVPGYGWTSNVSDFQQPDVIKSLQDRLAFTQDLIKKRTGSLEEYLDKVNSLYGNVKDLNLSFKVGNPMSYLGGENSYAASVIGKKVLPSVGGGSKGTS